MLKKYIGVAIVGVLLLESCPAFAGRHWRGEHRWGHGYVVRRLPPGYFTLKVSGSGYLYRKGLFYKHSPAGYIIVEPPVGAVVPVLPHGYTTVVVQRTPYYYYEDTYYTAAPNGYVVAATPPAALAPAPVPSIQSSISPTTKTEYKDTIDSYDIYIPNQNGSYTLVTLKKTDKGFIGPQGEFYPEHPTVEQLKTLYGKK